MLHLSPIQWVTAFLSNAKLAGAWSWPFPFTWFLHVTNRTNLPWYFPVFTNNYTIRCFDDDLASSEFCIAAGRAVSLGEILRWGGVLLTAAIGPFWSSVNLVPWLSWGVYGFGACCQNHSPSRMFFRRLRKCMTSHHPWTALLVWC